MREKIIIWVIAFCIAIPVSLGMNLIITPCLNWAIHLFNGDITLSFWQVYGLNILIGFLFKAGRK